MLVHVPPSSWSFLLLDVGEPAFAEADLAAVDLPQQPTFLMTATDGNNDVDGSSAAQGPLHHNDEVVLELQACQSDKAEAMDSAHVIHGMVCTCSGRGDDQHHGGQCQAGRHNCDRDNSTSLSHQPGNENMAVHAHDNVGNDVAIAIDDAEAPGRCQKGGHDSGV